MPLVCILLKKFPYPGFQERKSSPKSKFWGRISCGRPRGYPGGRTGAKASIKPSKSWKNRHFGADVHDPKARTSMTPGGFKKLRSEKLRAEFSFPGFGPRKYEKTIKYKNGPRNDHTCIFSVFFSYFWGGQPGVGDFVIFFVHFRMFGILGVLVCNASLLIQEPFVR